MGRRNRPPIRLEIVGLSQWIFDACRQSSQALLSTSNTSFGSGRNGRAGVTASVSTDVLSRFQNVPKEEVELHSKIALLAVDFERAYGRRVEVRVFERSSNPVFDFFLRRGHANSRSNASSAKEPEFFVNGLRVFKGVPKSFSELDEAIDNAFGNTRP